MQLTGKPHKRVLLSGESHVEDCLGRIYGRSAVCLSIILT